MKRALRKIKIGVVVLLSISAAMARADVVLDWNVIMLNTIGGQNPFAQARFAAITQTAVFEAVNAITRPVRSVSRDDRRAARGVSGGRCGCRRARRTEALLSGQ